MKYFILVFGLFLVSCTDNANTKTFGGTQEIKLKPNEKFLNVTWKEANMWIITQDTVTGISYCREKSSFGIWEGTVVIK